MADQGVPDGHLVEMRQRPEQHQVLEVEVVARVDPEPEGVRQVGRLDVAAEAPVHVVRALRERARERLRVELDPRRAQRGRPLHRRRLRLDEEADADAAILQIADDRAELRGGRVGRPSRLARHFAGVHRHERALMRADLPHHRQEIGPRVALDVEFHLAPLRAQECGDGLHVVARDVAGVGARVHGDAGGAGGDADSHRVDDRGQGPAAGVAKRRDLVDVDAEPHGHPRCILTLSAISAAQPWISR